MLLRQRGIALIHARFSVSLWRFCLSWTPVSYFCLARSAIIKSSLYFLTLAIALRTHTLWPMQLRLVYPQRDPTSSLLAALEVLYKISADDRGSGIPKPPRSTLWTRIFQNSALNSYPPNRAGKRVSLTVFSIGPIIVPTSGTVVFRNCQ